MDERILVIDPEECIDCGACEPECPVEAIFPEDALPEKWEPFVKINYAFNEGVDVVNKLTDEYALEHNVQNEPIAVGTAGWSSSGSTTSRSGSRTVTRIADFAVAALGMHVIERTDRFTLVGVARPPRQAHAVRRGAGPARRARWRDRPARDEPRARSRGTADGHGERFEICDGLWIRLSRPRRTSTTTSTTSRCTTGDPEATAAAGGRRSA